MREVLEFFIKSDLALSLLTIVCLGLLGFFMFDRVLFQLCIFIVEKAKKTSKVIVLILGIGIGAVVIATPVEAQTKSRVTVSMTKGKKKASCVQRIKARRKALKDKEKFYKRKYGAGPRERRRLMS